MAANLQKHVTSCCHLRATRIQRWTARARLKRPRRLVPKVCNLQLVPTMALVVKTPLSFYKFHIVPLCSIIFHSFSFYFKLYPMISHLIPLIWIQHDGNWQNIIIHYPHMSTFLFYVVLFFDFIAVYHPPIQFCGLCCDTYELFMAFLEQFEDMCRRMQKVWLWILNHFDIFWFYSDIMRHSLKIAIQCQKMP